MPKPPPDPTPWPLEALWQAVEPTLPGFTCELLPTVDSTNSELMRRFKNGHTEPTLLVAEAQTAGRGRLGRQWHSERGDSLTFSLGMLLSPAAWSGLSLAVGVSLAESLDPVFAAHRHIGLKWPNDLWLAGSAFGEQKLGGVLIETASWEGTRYVVVGVGINIRTVTVPEGRQAAMPAGHLQLLGPYDAPDALLRVVPPLVQTVQAFSEFGFEPFQARFAKRDVLANREVEMSDGANGKAHGVNIDGALLVHSASGMQVVASSEISVRPSFARANAKGQA